MFDHPALIELYAEARVRELRASTQSPTESRLARFVRRSARPRTTSEGWSRARKQAVIVDPAIAHHVRGTEPRA